MGQQRVPFKVSGEPLPFQIRRPLAQDCARGQLLQINSAGNAVRCDGATPNLVAFGPADRDQLAGSGATDAAMISWQTFVSEYAASTIANDGPTDTDIAKVIWGVDTKTIGLLSNYGGSNRSMIGIVYGLDSDNQATPLFWTGTVAWCVARGVHIADNATAASYAYAADATASTDQGTAADPLLLPRSKTHGRITSIEIIPSADLAASGLTSYRTITVYKIDTLTNTVSAVVGTFTTSTQTLAKRVPTQFTLTGTSTLLDLLETDVLGFASLHTVGGATVPQSIIRVNMKVQ